MTKRTNIEHEACRDHANACPHCNSQPTLWQIDHADGVTRYLVQHHGLTTVARQCPNVARVGVGVNPDAAVDNWKTVCRDRLAQRVSRAASDRLFDKAQDEIELAIIPQPEQTIGDLFAAYGNLQTQVQRAIHRVVNIGANHYCVVYFDVAQHGIETRLLNKASDVPVKMIDSLMPDELVAFGQLQQRITKWVQDGMRTAFPIASHEDAYALYAKSASQQIAGQNPDSSE